MDYGIKVYPLYLGSMHSDSNYAVMGDTVATKAEPCAPHRLKVTPSTAFLIDHPEVGYILYDSGMPDNPEESWTQAMCDSMIIEKPEHSKMLNQLALVGVKPEDIKVVISSHWHMDHVGNDHLFAKTADFYVSRPEAEMALLGVMSSAEAEQFGYYIKDEVLMPRKSITYVEEDTINLFPGIDAYIMSGHTAGTMALYVHLKDQDLILVEDAISCRENYEGAASGGSYDSIGFLKNIKRIRKLAQDNNALVIFGHDQEQFESMKLAPEYYE